MKALMEHPVVCTVFLASALFSLCSAVFITWPVGLIIAAVCLLISGAAVFYAKSTEAEVNNVTQPAPQAAPQPAPQPAPVVETVPTQQPVSEPEAPPEQDWIDCAYCKCKGSVIGFRDAHSERLITCGVCSGRGRIFTDLWNQPHCRRCNGSGSLVTNTTQRIPIGRRRSIKRWDTFIDPCDVCGGTGREPKLASTG